MVVWHGCSRIVWEKSPCIFADGHPKILSEPSGAIMQIASIMSAMPAMSQPQSAKMAEVGTGEGLVIETGSELTKPIFAAAGRNEEVSLDGQTAQANMLDLLLAVGVSAGQTRGTQTAWSKTGEFGFGLAKVLEQGSAVDSVAESAVAKASENEISLEGGLTEEAAGGLAEFLGRGRSAKSGESVLMPLRTHLPLEQVKSFVDGVADHGQSEDSPLNGDEDSLAIEFVGFDTRIVGRDGKGIREGNPSENKSTESRTGQGVTIDFVTTYDVGEGSEAVDEWKGIREGAGRRKAEFFDFATRGPKFTPGDHAKSKEGLAEIFNSKGVDHAKAKAAAAFGALTGSGGQFALAVDIAEERGLNLQSVLASTGDSMRVDLGVGLDGKAQTQERQIGLAEWIGSRQENQVIRDMVGGKTVDMTDQLIDTATGQLEVSKSLQTGKVGAQPLGSPAAIDEDLLAEISAENALGFESEADLEQEKPDAGVSVRDGRDNAKVRTGSAGGVAVEESAFDDAELLKAFDSKDADKDGLKSAADNFDTIRAERKESSSRMELVEKLIDSRQPSKMAKEVGDLIAARRSGNFEVRLFPENMGEIEISVRQLGRAVDIQLAASDERVSKDLKAHRGELVAAIEARGMNVHQVSVAKETNGSGLNPQQQGHEAQAGMDSQGRQESGRATREDFSRAVALSGGRHDVDTAELKSAYSGRLSQSVDYTV